MELDLPAASGSTAEISTAAINLAEDSEPLPAVVIGSEAWHSQVPAVSVPFVLCIKKVSKIHVVCNSKYFDGHGVFATVSGTYLFHTQYLE